MTHPAAEFFTGGGEMGERIRAFDWSQTPLGPVTTWSPSLKMMVRFLLANRFPHLLWWGPEFIQIYNDPYRPILGTKHPSPGLGRSVRECWSEIWHILQPLIETPYNGGPSTWMEDIFLEINRHGFVEETHFTIAYSPVPDETVPGGIGGVLATVHEITGKVIGERRVVALRDLGARVGETKTAEEACAIAAQTLAGHDKDIPFVLLYLIDPDRKRARLAGAAGVLTNEAISPATVDLTLEDAAGWPFADACRTENMQVVDRLKERFSKLPPGPWSDPPNTAVVIPIPSNKAHEPAGIMVAGVSARIKLDPFYRDFIELVRTQIATSIANARAYEEERRRAEALAELDRAKTVFFSNVSHEFRTPLTLMLGPMEDTLASAHGELPVEAAATLRVAHRNGLRLLRLVNNLLDFSRIEAGRIEASYQPTDLATCTAEVASVFRSAIEKAGLRLVVGCQPLPEEVYVDREMWEKIVLNLLSNAFKFTFDGEINVALRWCGDHVELSVRDNGVGIPSSELKNVFVRFHRVRGSRSRTHEGTGIGLALVQELARLHGGDVKVASVENSGSTFTVSILTGNKHLPADRIDAPRTRLSTSARVDSFTDEALGWMDGVASTIDSGKPHSSNGHPPHPLRILLADDNADMRSYVRGLLSLNYEVEAVPNGKAALDAARERVPDLVLTDVMMPVLDGFGLLKELRSGERTRTIPVIMLSARAGEESRVEGLDAGADDYLVKPFSARELLARVRSQLEMARLRRQHEEKLERTVEQRTLKLRETVQELESYSYSISHDMRAPLRAIQAYGQVLLDELGPRLDDSNRRYLNRIMAASNRMDKLITDVLSYSRLARGEIVLKLDHLVEEITYQYPTLQAADIKTSDHLGSVIAAEALLSQAIANLLTNAAKFVVPGNKPHIKIWSEDSMLDATPALKLFVRDHGIGIAPENQQRIFGIFNRVHTEKQYEGTGIGLSIVKKAVQRMNGQVGLISALGQGSTFWLQLPKA